MSLAHQCSEYLVEDNRFIILEDYGCSQSILVTWVSLLIIYIPPILLEIVAGVYGCLSIRAFYKRSKNTQINDFNFDSNRYLRLIFFSVCDLLVGIPIALFYLYISTTEFIPFPGLKEEHYDFSYIIQVPAADWRATTLGELGSELNRWIIVWGAFVFFAIFGFTEESRNNYRAMLQSVVQVFVKITGIKSRPKASSKDEGCVISVFFAVLRLICCLESCSTTRIIAIHC
jgi:pheromone a factor receptor